MAFIGSQNVSSRLQAFLISLSYVLGLALTYTALGAFSTIAGTFFGRIAAHPVTNILVGAIFIFFGFSMLDIFLIPIPRFLQKGFAGKIPSQLKGTYAGAFLIGMASGLVVGSCTLPVLAALLTYVASKKISILYGSLLLFTYAMGLGMIFLFAGTFSSLFTSLLKSGKWMIAVKKVLASVIIFMGIYFVYLAARSFF
ncbi:MAG: sulfite exporter TauE/SafE family protein [Candidatus Aureabacteria bacterium]|nr:sulfite exporter TauE/SafE family protein [Candidatus Auribacterota bacterium]